MAKKLPIGIQSIRKILTDGYTYVDKTEYAKQLIDEGCYYFMSRPRRFGKSLFISTLEEILLGNESLFKDCCIGKSNYEWVQHPVIHFDFTQIPARTPDALENGLFETMDKIAASYKVSILGTSLQMRLASLVEQLAKKASVAVLVDEYDKPIIDNLSKVETADINRDILRNFFGTLKGLDKHLKFVFITGVSKFSQVSLFSGFNNLQDLTMDPPYSTLMGYTKKEVQSYFSEHISCIAKSRNLDDQDILLEIKEWYNGYCFSEKCEPVFNPFSTLSYLKSGLAKGYWFSSGTPSFLIEQVKAHPLNAVELSGAKVKRSQLLDIQNLSSIDLRALMWQTGYLTISGYDNTTDLYELNFPNREVRSAFFDTLLQEFQASFPSDVVNHAEKIRAALQECNLKAFFKIINTYYSKIPYNLHIQAKEGFYHAVFLSLMEGMGFKTRAEESTSVGRIDLVIETDDIVFIFELKVDQNASTALEQAELKNYCEKYFHQNRKLAVIGVNFCTQSRDISEWTGKLFSASGELLQMLSKVFKLTPRFDLSKAAAAHRPP